MAAVIQPWQVFVVAVAGWISRQQDAVIEYLREENCVLKQQIGGKRLRVTDAQRRRLAAKGKILGYNRTRCSWRTTLRVCARTYARASA